MQKRDEHFFEDDDRNRLLEAIEQQAKSLSMARGSNQHRLSDWLNAAEEVMPEVKKPAVKQMSLANNPESKSNTAQIIWFLLAGTLMLTLAGAGGFSYFQLTQQIDNLEKNSKAMIERIAELEKAVQESDQKITRLQAADMSNGFQTEETKTEQTTNKSSIQQLESLLDARFKQLIDALDNRTQHKAAMSSITTQPAVQPMNVSVPTINPVPAASIANVSTPVAPQINEIKIAQSSSDNTQISDVQHEWLQSLPADALVLQLGSNPKADGLAAIGAKIKKNTNMTHVISVKANGSTRYILVYGAFTTRDEARQAADDVKADIGVTAWIRRAADVKLLLEKR
jgi:septal ring-binding cell division protein DamX